MPAFCRVAGDIRPVADSDIKFEIWLPLEKWNGRFEAVGNGGVVFHFAGYLEYAAMAAALTDGYATASTDTGHAEEPGGSAGGSDFKWPMGHPEKVIDFGYRAAHEMTVQSKAVIDAFYGSKPTYSYWNGCSEGGRQGMGEAERYPDDYNGILAGAPLFNFTDSQTRAVISQKFVYEDPSLFIPAAKYKLIYDAVLAQCDAADGVKDGVINDPQQCHFDPSALLCQKGDAANCLTASQVRASKSQYAAVVNPRTHERILLGKAPGFEVFQRANKPPVEMNKAQEGSFYRYFVLENPEWDWTTFDGDKDVALARKKLGGILDNYDPNLAKFKSLGGKLIQYHGWSDPGPSALNTVDYFKRVQSRVGDSQAFYRLFMVPGMGHCIGGPGTDQFDEMGAITAWVEKGKAPERILASHVVDGRVTRTRPLCPYPQIAKYQGSGSTDDAANFACVKPQ
jgi:feruloyl esterase